MNRSEHYDIAIAGAGFAGAITALVLKECGFNICLIEKGKHPRFAIGESSTPIADMILRSLSSKYNLPWLYDFSRYGSWQQAHPEIVCGIKRGFSYYKHYPGKAFSTDDNHINELLVAASVSDELSDTNWLRSDIDAFLVTKVREAGIGYFDGTEITSAIRENSKWEIAANYNNNNQTIHASFFIDATGSGILADKLFSVKSSAENFLTNSFAIFSHFDNLPRWTDILRQKNIATNDYPYDADNSALHHVLDEGWIWQLRFNNNRTSWGFVLNANNLSLQKMQTKEIWNMMREKYSDIDFILKDAMLSAQPGNIIRSGRLQRKLEKCFGDGWVAMPHTIGFVDPLFSTGIAYSLAGIERIAEILSGNRNFQQPLYDELQEYENIVTEELKLIDLLVAGCYKTMEHFQLFNAWSMLYFTFTIMYEQKRLKNLPVKYFLEADKAEVQQMAHSAYKDLLKLTQQETISQADISAFTDSVREKIKPYNIAGLMEPSFKNMYHHTVAVL
ncbi:NAD(P)/FAD-dependent oxidoreductase [Parafilimonas terrae]|uniref:NAD(P)/FAD-dependent oxidoreductase n=1 Tax=Parafilimonas terrae TaxID=1465490 RepID=UPI0015A60110|nr:tryptophan 7-halogenase [Parafilimonas terrae]